MKNKKIIVGISALVFAFIMFMGASTIARANENSGNGNQGNHFGENKGWKEQKDEAHNLGSTLEVHIGDNGKVLVRGAKVTAISGNTVTATTAWDSASLTWTITQGTNLEILRRFGGTSSISEISVGDLISFSGTLMPGATFTVEANVIKNWSVQRAHATFVGTVSSINASAQSFVLASEDNGSITVQTNSGTQFNKGDATGAFGDITVGAKVSAGGLYDNQNKILTADKVKVYAITAVRTTLEGKIVSIAGTTAPTTFVLNAHDVNYTINVGVDTSVLNNNWLHTSLTNFAVGNDMRVYGTVNTNNTVDATVVRDTNI